MTVVDEIKARLDIVTYIQQYAPLKKAGRYYKACCPFHSEKTPSFTVNPDTQSWRCFGACAEGGDVFSFAMKQHGWTFNEALQALGQMVGVEARQQSPEQKQHSDQLDQLRGLLSVAAELYHHLLTETPIGAATLQYAREQRGFSDDTLTRFQIGFAPEGWHTLLDELKQLGYTEDQALAAGLAKRSDKGRVYDVFRNRLMIPIRDERGRVTGFGARALSPDDSPKYLNSPQSAVFDKSKTLFGLDTAKKAIRETETAVIVEGYMDAIQAQQAGYTNVVAQMGTALTEDQLKLIAPRYAKKIILALDADAAGQNATMRSLDVARQTLQADFAGRLSVDFRILHIPDAKDPDDFIRADPQGWANAVDHAIPVADFVIDVETRDLPANASLQEREAVARRVLPVLIASESDLYAKDNLQKLARRLRIGERDLLAWAQREAPPPKPMPKAPPLAPVVDNDDDAPYMPPLDYDRLPPPEWDGRADDVTYADGTTVHIAQATPAMRPPMPDIRRPPTQSNQGYALEAYCLRMLLLQPDLLYTVNRKFRELAKGQSGLLKGALCDLGADDFQHSVYRAVMSLLEAALRQDEGEALAYVREQLNPLLLPTFERLLLPEADELYDRLRQRFEGDVRTSWQQHERRRSGLTNATVEMVDKALRLRLTRLKRETEALRFLQMDIADELTDSEAESEQAEAEAMTYIQALRSPMQAQPLIETELKQLSRYFV
ncbi:MAG: DNA primase [Armatimonadetes bacterium]|nr:DNA primase [Anaerolineae bacterium]